jgi:CRP-like cAMP-binding protein
MQDLEEILAEHPFFSGFDSAHRHLVAGCARNHRFDAGRYLFREGESADEFFLIRHGRVALEIASPGHASIVIATLGAGDIVGASWLVSPYRWTFDARALEVTRAIGIDASCLRGKCDVDHDFGYAMMTRFVPILVNRLHATRLQLLDVYGRR